MSPRCSGIPLPSSSPWNASEFPRVPAFSPDGRFLAAAGHSEFAGVWSSDGKEIARLPGHSLSPRGPNFACWASPSLLVTGGMPLLHVWSIPEGRRLRTIDPGAPTSWLVEAGRVMAFVWGEDPAGHDLELRSWMLPDGPQQPLARIDWTALGAADWMFAPSGRGLIYAKGNVIVLRPLPAAGGTLDRVIGRHDTDVLRVNPLRGEPEQIWSHDKAGAIRIWSFSESGLELQKELRRPETAPAETFGLELDGRLIHDALAGWAAGTQLRAWDTAALPGAQPVTLRRRGSWYGAAVAFHPEGDWAVASTENFTRLTFWPLRQPRATVVPGYSTFMRPVAFSPDGRWLATSWSDSTLRLWPMPGTGLREPKTVGFPEPSLWERMAFDPQGRYLFAVGNNDRAWIVPLNGSPPRRLPVHSEDTLLYSAAVSPSGRQVATAWGYGRGAKTLRLHDVETGETREFPLPGSSPVPPRPGVTRVPSYLAQMISSLAFMNESTLYSAGEGGVRRWTLQTGTQELVAQAGISVLSQPLPDGRTALAQFCQPEGSGCTRHLLDLVTGRSRSLPAFGVPRGANGGCDAVSGAVVAAGDAEGIVHVGLASGGPVHWLEAHAGPVQAVALSPDQRWVASTGEDDTLRLWPMPDLSKPPMHALPHEALIGKLRSLTNLRAVRAPGDSMLWKVEVGPFPGWKDVPTW